MMKLRELRWRMSPRISDSPHLAIELPLAEALLVYVGGGRIRFPSLVPT